MNRICVFGKSLLLLPMLLILSGCPPDEYMFWSYIDREFSSPAEEALILLAEQACPAREDVLAAADPADGEGLEAEAGDGCLWWYRTEEGIRVPYAVTADALEYYQDRVEELRHQTPSYPVWRDVGLTYTASIEPGTYWNVDEKQDEEIYLVHMSLSYGEGFWMPLMDYWFDIERTVAISLEGEVLAIFGDGPAEWEVWKQDESTEGA